MYRLGVTRGLLNVVRLIVVSCYPGSIIAQPMDRRDALIEVLLLSKEVLRRLGEKFVSISLERSSSSGDP
ncbi:hypothetical protein BC826DRAFT_1032751 [Russula brevipes]|nr:hypothetical protein BC826DRAFT_1032751 [Russula brevipes]